MRRMHVLAVAATSGALLAALVVPTSAAENQSETARRHLVDTVQQAAATAAPGSTNEPGRTPQAARGCWADPTGDTTPGPYARADMTGQCAEIGDGSITMAMEVAQPTNPNSDENWRYSYYTGLVWGLDVNGDQSLDYFVGIVNDGSMAVGAVMDAYDNLLCDASVGYDGTTYSGTFPAACIGSPRQLWTYNYVTYDSQWDDPYAPVYEDFSTTFHGPVAAPSPTTTPPPASPDGPAEKGRLSGETRFDTAVRISRHQFPDGAAEVYLARADNFPDALAGGTLTGGPILLVPQCGQVPQAVLDEILRLRPLKVIALGGKVAVCEQVLDDAVAAAR